MVPLSPMNGRKMNGFHWGYSKPPLDPQGSMKNEGFFNPPNMGEITPENDGCRFAGPTYIKSYK